MRPSNQACPLWSASITPLLRLFPVKLPALLSLKHTRPSPVAVFFRWFFFFFGFAVPSTQDTSPSEGCLCATWFSGQTPPPESIPWLPKRTCCWPRQGTPYHHTLFQLIFFVTHIALGSYFVYLFVFRPILLWSVNSMRVSGTLLPVVSPVPRIVSGTQPVPAYWINNGMSRWICLLPRTLCLQLLSLGVLFSPSPTSLCLCFFLSWFHLKAFCLMTQSKDQIKWHFCGGVSPNLPRKFNFLFSVPSTALYHSSVTSLNTRHSLLRELSAILPLCQSLLGWKLIRSSLYFQHLAHGRHSLMVYISVEFGRDLSRNG